jgi:hypothetical protein
MPSDEIRNERPKKVEMDRDLLVEVGIKLHPSLLHQNA